MRNKKNRLAIPKEAVLRGRRYRVYKRHSKEMEKRNAVGLCSVDEPWTINLEPNQAPGEMDATWVHELLHAIWPRRIVSDEVEEKLIRGLEYRLRDAVARGYLRAV